MKKNYVILYIYICIIYIYYTKTGGRHPTGNDGGYELGKKQIWGQHGFPRTRDHRGEGEERKEFVPKAQRCHGGTTLVA